MEVVKPLFFVAYISLLVIFSVPIVFQRGFLPKLLSNYLFAVNNHYEVSLCLIG